jgi:radical SAM protein with 4Fe4S-binding SPASM domain
VPTIDSTRDGGVRYDVVAIGNALVDVIAAVEDQFLEVEQVVKGSMTLVYSDRSAHLYSRITKPTQTSGGSSLANQIQLPLEISGTYNFTVDWGDGSPIDTITVWNDPLTLHTYGLAGTYTITITGQIEGFVFANTGDKNKLLNQCWRMWQGCVVTWDGSIVPCCFDKDAKYKLGQLKSESFNSIWFSDEYNKFRKSILKSRNQIDICNNCTEGTSVWVKD